MKQLYCLNCCTIQNVYTSTYAETTVAEDGNRLPVINISYYCEECNIFLESETKPDKYLDYENII